MPVINPSADHIAAQVGGFEPQRKCNWAIDFAIGDGNAEQILSLSLKASPFPKESNVKKSIKYFNETRHYAGSVTPFDALNVRYHDYVDRATLAALYAWRRQCWDPNSGAIGLAAQYKKRGTLYFYPPNAIDGTTGARTWKLIGAWPVSLFTDELDMDNDGDPVEISCEVSIDRAIPEFQGGSPLNTNGNGFSFGVGATIGLGRGGVTGSISIGGGVRLGF